MFADRDDQNAHAIEGLDRFAEVMKMERGRGQSFPTDGDAWQPNSDPRKEHRVGKNCDTEKINEHRGVP